MAHPMRMISGRLVCGVAAAWIAMTAQALSQSDLPSSADDLGDDQITAAIEQLASSKFRKRQAAFEFLIESGLSSIGALENAAKTQPLEQASRCVEALAQIAREKKQRQAALDALDRITEDGSNRVAGLAGVEVEELRLTKEQRAVAKLQAAGAMVHRDSRGNIFSVTLNRDRDVAWLRHLPPIRYISLMGQGISNTGIKALVGNKGITTVSMYDTAVTDFGLRQLKDIKSLRSLSLASTLVSTDGLRQLKHVKGLRSLSLSRMRDDWQLEFLSDVPQIESLRLSDMHLTQFSPEFLNPLGNLKRLSISLTDADDRELRYLAKINVSMQLSLMRSPRVTMAGWNEVAKSTITRLSVMNTPIRDDSLAALGNITSLESLSIYDAPISDAGLEHLKQLKSLRYLTLRDTKVTDDGVARLREALPNIRRSTVNNNAKIARAPAVEPIGFTVSKLTGKRSAHLRVALTKELVETLKKEKDLGTIFLTRASLKDEHLVMLAEVPMTGLVITSEEINGRGFEPLENHATLSSITIRSSTINGEAVESFGRMPALTRLSIRGCGAADAAFAAMIGQLGQRGKLTSLTLGDCPNLTGKAFRPLAGLQSLERLCLSKMALTSSDFFEQAGRLPKLTDLQLDGIRVDQADVPHLKGTPIESFHVNNTDVTDPWVEVVAATLPGLKRLSLQGTMVTDAAMPAIAKLSDLESLYLRTTEVGDAGLAHLEKLNNLKYVYVNAATVTAEAIERFKEKYPEIKIR